MTRDGARRVASSPCRGPTVGLIHNSPLVAVVSTLTLALAGCVVGPDYRPPETHLPERWSGAAPNVATTQPAALAQWWTAFDDPVLNTLVERAVRSNRTLRAAAARVGQARAERAIAGADLWPRLEAAGSYAHEGESRNRRPAKPRDSWGRRLRDAVVDEAADEYFNGSFDAAEFVGDVAARPVSDALTRPDEARLGPRGLNRFAVALDASWEIDVFGRVRRSQEAAAAEAAAAEEDYRDVLAILLFDVARAYVEARGCQQRIAIARENIAAQQETLRLARFQCDGGFGSELDVAQAETQLASTRAALTLLETSFRHTIHQVSLLLGEVPDATLAELSPEAPIPPAPPEIPLGLPSDLLRLRPDIRRCERRLAAATARVGVATADLFPRFSLTGTFGSESHDVRHILDSRSLFWSVGPAVSWPVFTGGRVRANIEVQSAVQQQALAEYEETILTALKEVEDALCAYRSERVRHEYLAEAVAAARRAVSLATAQYNEGVSDFLAVVDSERSLHAVEDRLVQSQTALTLHTIRLFKALGGGWESWAGPQ